MLRKDQTHAHAFLMDISKQRSAVSLYPHSPSHTPSNIGSKQLDFTCFNGMRPHTSQRWECIYTHSYPISVQYVWGAWELWVNVGISEPRNELVVM